MALTEKEKHKVVRYLGWSGLTIVANSTQFNSVVNDRLSVTTAEICKIAKEMLEKIELIDEQREQANCRLAASKVDDITMNERELAMLCKERMKWIRELSDHLDIPIMKSGGGIKAVIV